MNITFITKERKYTVRRNCLKKGDKARNMNLKLKQIL